MRFRWLICLVFIGWFVGLSVLLKNHLSEPPGVLVVSWEEFFSNNLMSALPVNDTFDFPVRPPDGQGAFVTVKFWEDHHLGEDWNTAEEDKDLGEPVYSCGDGIVTFSQYVSDLSSTVVTIAYRLPPGKLPSVVEMMYANLDQASVASGAMVKRGQKIGSMGNAEGKNKAHLHWEVRQLINLGIESNYYSQSSQGWVNPRQFIFTHRQPQKECLAQEIPLDQEDRWGSD